MVACENWNAETVRHLLERGADMHKCANDGSTALHHAANSRVDEFRKTPIIQVLHQLRASDIDARDSNGATPLLLACRVGRLHVVEKLLNMGTDISLADNNGVDPITAAELTRDERLDDPELRETSVANAEKILELLKDYKLMYNTAKPKPKQKLEKPTSIATAKPKSKSKSKSKSKPKSTAVQNKTKSARKQTKKREPSPTPSRSQSPETVAVGGWNLRHRKAEN
jgi:ankyrin repeat protein